MKKIKIFAIFVSLAVLASLTLAACSGNKNGGFEVYDAAGELVFSMTQDTIDIEYGEIYMIPANVAIKGKKKTAAVALIDPNGNAVRLSYNSASFVVVGKYSVTYTVDEKTYTMYIDCADTVLPTINVVSYTMYAVEGDTVPLPKATYGDAAGIDETSERFVVTDPDGADVNVTANGFVVSKIGKYTVTIYIKDNNGLESSAVRHVEVREKYIDAQRGENVIYSFDTEDYLTLMQDIEIDQNITRTIVGEADYPVALDAEYSYTGNAAVKMTSDKVYGDVYTRFILHEDLLASNGYKIVIRFLATQDVAYIKLHNHEFGQSSMNMKSVAAQMFGVKAGTWYELEVDPIAFGYNMTFKDFIIQYRDTGGTALYIDDISFILPEFTDADISDTLLADFDETGYLHNVFQNVYCDPTTSRAFRVGGTKFDILEQGNAGIPAANGSNTVAPGIGANGGVLKGTTVSNYGGMTYMFHKPLSANQLVGINFRLYVESGFNGVVIGFFNGDGLDGGNNYWGATWGNPYYTKGAWRDLTVTGRTLETFVSDGKVSGFYMQFLQNRGADDDYEITFYLDEVTAVYKDGVSEQQGSVLADFSNDSTANALNNAYVDASVFETVSAGGAVPGGAGKVLKVTPAKSGSGLRYVFDESISVSESESIVLTAALPAATPISSIELSVLTAALDAVKVKTIQASEMKGSYAALFITGGEIAATNAAKQLIIGISIKINFSAQSENNVLYINSIKLYDASLDTDSPTIVSKADTAVNIYGDMTVSLKGLDIVLSDPSDPNPQYIVTGVSNPDSVEVEVNTENATFTPTKTGGYTVRFKAVDSAGNESAEDNLTVTVTKHDNKKSYYAAQLAFADSNSVAVVNEGLNPTVVGDTNAADGKALSGTFNRVNAGTATNLVIDLGEVYELQRIQTLAIRYRFTACLGDNDWWRLYFNDAAQFAATDKCVVSDEYTTLSLSAAQIMSMTGLSRDSMLSTLAFGFNNEGKSATIQIDSIVVTEKTVDSDAPVITASDYLANIRTGGIVDLNNITIGIADADSDAYFVIEGITGSGGSAVPSYDAETKTFTPDADETYTVTIKAYDSFGNTATKAVSVVVNVFGDDADKAYYAAELEFGSNTFLNIVTSGVNPTVVGDTNAEDGKALSGTFNRVNAGTATRLTIDLGEVYELQRIQTLVIRYRFTASLGADDWWRLYFNDAAQFAATDKCVVSDEYTTLSLSAAQIMSATGLSRDAMLSSLAFGFNNDAKSSTIRIDSIVVTEKTADSDAPVITASDYLANIRTGGIVDLNNITIGIADADSDAYFVIEGITGSGGSAVPSYDAETKTFTPDADETYTVTIKAYDSFGNTATKAVSVVVNVFGDDADKAYYAAELEFGSNTFLNIVTSGVNPTVVGDTNAEDGKALSGTFNRVNADKATRLTIDLGEVYELQKIQTLVIRYRFTACLGDNDWWRLYFNDAAQFAATDKCVVSDEYTTLSLSAAQIMSATGLSRDAMLSSLAFGFDSDAKSATIQIDSIVVTEKTVDSDAPVITAENSSFNYYLTPGTIDLGALITVSDADADAYYVIEGVTSDGALYDYDAATKVLTPAATGVYTVAIRAYDSFGNTSTATMTLTVTVFEADEEKAYYAAELAFSSKTSVGLVTNGVSSSIVSDTNAADGKALSGSFTSATKLSISLGTSYKIDEIGSIVINYRFTSGSSWWQLLANGTSTYLKSEPVAVSDSYAALFLTTTDLRKLTGQEYLTSLEYGNTTATVYIESIVIKTVDEAREVLSTRLQFNTEDSLELVTSKKDYASIVPEDVPGVTALSGSFVDIARLVLDFGGLYKIEDIGSIKITHRFASTGSGIWWWLIANGGENTASLADGTANATAAYSELTITAATLREKVTGTYLNTLEFLSSSWERKAIINIDSIVITLMDEARETLSTRLQFNTSDSLALITSGTSRTITDDEKANGGKALSGAFSAATKLKIDFGGLYQLDEIGCIVINYRFISGSSWWQLLANGTSTYLRSEALAVSEDYKALVITATDLRKLTGQKYLTSLEYGNTTGAINIGSIQILTVDEAKAYMSTLLQFNVADSLDLVRKSHDHEWIAEDETETGVSAVRGKFTDTNRFIIYVGGLYKIDEIATVQIRLRTITTPWWRVFVNGGTTKVNEGSSVVAYTTLTVTQAALSAAITDNGYLDSLELGFESYNVGNAYIDSIVINPV